MKLIPLAAATVIGVAACASGAWAQGGGDRHFLDEALKGDNSEMMLGEMAAQRGASPGLRAFGQTLHDDHAQARQQVIPLAQQAGVAISNDPAPEAARERRKLEALHGAAFDREFARYMVKDHEKDISDFQAEAAKSGPVADLARQSLPVLRKHLEMARRLSHG